MKIFEFRYLSTIAILALLLLSSSTRSTLLTVEIHYMEDFNGDSTDLMIQTYQNNNLTVQNGVLRIEALSNTYAYVSQNTSLPLLYFETKIRMVSGISGISWATGVGIYWNENNIINLAIGNYPDTVQRLNLVYRLNNESGAYNYETPIGYNNWYWIHIEIINDSTLSVQISPDGINWRDYISSSTKIFGNDILSYNLTKVIPEMDNCLIMAGKGYQPAPGVDTIVGNYPFNTIYTPDLGSIGISEIDYVEYALTGSTNPVDITTTSTFIENATDTSTVTETVNITNTINSSNPSLQLGNNYLFTISSTFIVVILSRKHIKN